MSHLAPGDCPCRIWPGRRTLESPQGVGFVQHIVPNIWCQGNAEEAGHFYANVFPNTESWVSSRYPETGLLDFQTALAGKPLTVEVKIGDYEISLINAGEEFTPNPAISFMVTFDPRNYDDSADAARAALDQVWVGLNDGGTALMPLDSYPFSEHYGWVQDRFGVSWQLITPDPLSEPRPFIRPSLMFAGPAQNHAGQAVNHYLDTFGEVFGDSDLGQFETYDEWTGPAEPGALQFGDFRIGDNWLVAMDSGAEQAFTFTEGVSLEVRCEDQAEIDALWDALSAVPEAEQCGWLTDRFGVHWQIIPRDIGALMERPEAFEHLMSMKKIVIADL